MLIISLVVNSFSEGFCSAKVYSSDTISAVQDFQPDVINSKDSELIVQSANRVDGISINNKKTDNPFGSGINKFIDPNLPQFEALLSYIYTLSYLKNMSKVTFLTLLTEVQPNAP